MRNIPQVADRVLFEMGIIYAHPRNEQKDYQKSLECFQKLVRDYPESAYRQDSEMMILQINNVIIKDKMIAAQQTQIETPGKRLKAKRMRLLHCKKRLKRSNKRFSALRDGTGR